MKSLIVKVCSLHLLVLLVYLFVTSYLFVTGKDPNPIGIGLLQWILFFLHLILTLLFCLFVLKKANDIKYENRIVMVNTLAIIFWITIYFLFSSKIWDLLWSLRK